MRTKSRKKRARSQGRKSAVVVPSSPELDEHANLIRTLARQSFDDIVEIGERLACCRELLKNERQWLAWLSAEFRWSRRHADRFIAVAKNKRKCATLRTLGLPISALFELATASPKLIQKIERDIRAGEQPSVREIEQQVRAERLVITATPTAPQSAPRLQLVAPLGEPTEQRTFTIDDLQRIQVDRQAAEFPLLLEVFAHRLAGHAPHAIAAALPAAKRTTIIQDVDVIIKFLNELKRVLWETGRPRAV